ncbi:MAG: FAD-binding oxidoreductase [Leptolyngbyaceae cyanobacterium RU_5_1]|nr:FAD-binding oxidoreductase [Leptolyngbyaceae cyanobacterium RU_5_1]
MRVAIVGCGVIGSAIAHELSQVPGLTITVLDQQAPAQAATGAALGVLMAVISQKTRGNALQMRLTSIQRYDTWIPQLETLTGCRIPFNRHGILRLCFAGEDLDFWRSLAEIRREQGWQLDVCDRNHLAAHYPQLNLDGVIGAVYSPRDRQVDPTALTLALVAAAEQKGVTFLFDTAVTSADCGDPPNPPSQGGQQGGPIRRIHTTADPLETDWLVIAAGLGSTPLTAHLQHPVEIRPVLGQAMHVRLSQPLGQPDLQPVITGNDVHIVPLSGSDYWIGATVEFPDPADVLKAAPLQPNPELLAAMLQQAIAFYPALATATVLRTWSGLRPRPHGRPAPIIEPLPGYANVLLATGHYRNGVLLAPATAERVREAIATSDFGF